ncbi:hypothetical protein [Leuconostoc suionicum]|uniref:hypothetical protein n=1 Tax=Leuconostoc suionicum TaxID=1511761 RepID=UPI001B8D64BF|nr:hypothetical protein [Leuconostoc suionicum]MBS1008222.1 hypothetical protein [Leuconostoc suionicum]
MKYAIIAATGKFRQATTNKLLKIVSKEDAVLIIRNENKVKKLFSKYPTILFLQLVY